MKPTDQSNDSCFGHDFSNQMKVFGLGGSLCYYKRPACCGEVSINQDTLEQTDRSEQSDSKNNWHIIVSPIGREKISDLRKSCGIVLQDKMDIGIQSHVLY